MMPHWIEQRHFVLPAVFMMSGTSLFAQWVSQRSKRGGKTPPGWIGPMLVCVLILDVFLLCLRDFERLRLVGQMNEGVLKWLFP